MLLDDHSLPRDVPLAPDVSHVPVLVWRTQHQSWQTHHDFSHLGALRCFLVGVTWFAQCSSTHSQGCWDVDASSDLVFAKRRRFQMVEQHPTVHYLRDSQSGGPLDCWKVSTGGVAREQRIVEQHLPESWLALSQFVVGSVARLQRAVQRWSSNSNSRA